MAGTVTAAAAFDQPGRAVAVDGVRYALRRLDPPGGPAAAAGPPVLLLHGFPQTSLVWRSLAPLLSVDRVVLAPDLRGLGDSEVRGPYDLPAIARDLAALVGLETADLETAGLPWDGRVDVVGHDIGGTLALALAGARPDLVRRLVDLSGPYRHLDLLHAWHVPLAALPALPEAAFAAGGRRMVPTMVRYAWRSPSPMDPDLLARYVAAYTGPDRIGALLGYYRAASRPQIAALARRLGRGIGGNPFRTYGGGPTFPIDRASLPARLMVAAERSLIVWGAADPSTPLQVGEAVVRDLERDGVAPVSIQLVTLPGVGHFPVEEAPADVLPLVTDFLQAR